jgi:hypothetical protein
MKKKINFMYKVTLRSLASVFALVLLLSCENEYSEVGTDFINSLEVPPAYELENLVTYSEKYTSIQTNGFNNYFLGAYVDPVFGISETKILTQVSLSQTRPDFGENPSIDSVVFTLPFFSREVESGIYELDSIYGEGSFKINIYESNQFLRDLDPGENGEFEENQIYYSDQGDEFSPNIASTPLVTSDVIKPSDLTSSVILFEQTETNVVDTLNLSPRIRIKMPTNFFQEKILAPANSEFLISNNAFRNYLRGFLIEAEQQQPVYSMPMFNLANEDANITIYYNNETQVEEEDGTTTTDTLYSQYALNFSGNKLNLYDNNFNVDLSNQNLEEGEENIYLKGGEGSSAVIELFTGPDTDGNGVSDELDQLRENNWLINEANLSLYLNEEVAPSNKNRINRVFLINLEDETVLEDYRRDPTAADNPNVSRQVHLGPLTLDENGDPFYKIRLTSHINNIINNDSTNVKLGLYVSSNVNQTSLVTTRNSQSEAFEFVPRSMIETPRGIVIHGNRSAVEAKKLKLKIFYTETN